jgi:hypothetical protein
MPPSGVVVSYDEWGGDRLYLRVAGSSIEDVFPYSIGLQHLRVPPTLAVTRQTPSNEHTNADTVVFNATFSEAVYNVDAADFVLTSTGTVAVNGAVTVGDAGDADPSTYTVTVDAISGDGELALELAADTDIHDSTWNALDTTLTNDETYTIDNTPPKVLQVWVGSTLWSQMFKDFVDTLNSPGIGHPIPEGPDQWVHCLGRISTRSTYNSARTLVVRSY